MAFDRTLVQIRERPTLDVLDLALVVIRDRPATLGLAAAAGIAPFVAFNAWFFSIIPETATGVPLFLWLLEGSIATAPLTVVLGGLMFDQKPTVRGVATTMTRSAFGLVMVHGICRIFLFFLIPSRLWFANEVILLERGKWWTIFRRGGDLSGTRSGEIFVLMLAQFGLVYLFATLAFVDAGRIAQAVMAEAMTWDFPSAADLAGLRFQLPIWAVVAFFTVVRFLTYIDQRIRLEGWEVELKLRSVGQALEEARRW